MKKIEITNLWKCLMTVILSLSLSFQVLATTYFVKNDGDDSLAGTSDSLAWKTLGKVNSVSLLPGDVVQFKKGDTFYGKIVITASGTSGNLITFKAYGGEGSDPVIVATGWKAAVHIQNAEYIKVQNLKLKNNGGEPNWGVPTDERYGVLLENDTESVLNHYRFYKLTVVNIYPTDDATDDLSGDVAHGSAFAMADSDGTKFSDLLINECKIKRTARHAIWMRYAQDLTIKLTEIDSVGGSGILIGKDCSDVLVENNKVVRSGSTVDSRMAGRGSGLWTFGSKRVIVQSNEFLSAKGKQDSYGMHIDFNNEDVVYQYNYSQNNEGGFIEILGNNKNVCYRYNISVGDGWRTRNNKPGKTIWVSDYAGSWREPDGVGSDSISIYNNTIFTSSEHSPDILIDPLATNLKIYNNIFYASGGFGPIYIYNDTTETDFDHNLWRGSIPITDQNGYTYRGVNAVTGNPKLVSPGQYNNPSAYQIETGSAAIGAGQLIYDASKTGTFDYFHSHDEIDYFGNSVSTSLVPHIGAYNGTPISGARMHSEVEEVSEMNQSKTRESLLVYPNSIKVGESIHIQLPEELLKITYHLQVYDMNGRSVFHEFQPSKEHMEVSTDELRKGIYILEVNTREGALHQRLLIED